MPLAKRLSIGLEIRQSELVKVAAAAEAEAEEVKPFTVLVAVAANWPARAQVKGAPISHGQGGQAGRLPGVIAIGLPVVASRATHLAKVAPKLT